MYPVLAQLGPLSFSTYAVLVNLGLIIALGWLYAAAPPERQARWLDVGLAALVGGLIGARLVYVLVHGGYYAAHIDEALMVWRGGLSWPGAALGGLAGAAWWARRTGEALPPILDALAAPLAILSALAWGGCLAAGCNYGVEVTPGQLPAWMITTAPDLYGLSVPRWPTQIAGVGWSLAVLGLVLGLRDRRWPAGAHGVYALSLVALGAFFISFLRGDPMPVVGGYRLDVIGGALVLVGAALTWAWLVRRPAS